MTRDESEAVRIRRAHAIEISADRFADQRLDARAADIGRLSHPASSLTQNPYSRYPGTNPSIPVPSGSMWILLVKSV
jgi:hypothetical protein